MKRIIRLTESDLDRIVRRVIIEDQEYPVTDIERMNQGDIMLKQYIDKFGQKYINMYNGDEYGYDMKTEKPFGSPKVYNNKIMDAKEKKMYRKIYSGLRSDIMGKIDNHMKDLGFPNSFHIPEDISRNDFDKLKKDWERSLTKSSVQNERDLSRIVKRVINESEKRKLVFESIMQTINEHGLHGAVGRSLLTEGDAPDKGFVFKDLEGKSPYKSATSLAEGQQIIQNLILVMSKGGAKEFGSQLAAVLGQITSNNYYIILWKVRYGSAFKSITKRNYNTIKDWIASKGMDRPTSGSGPVPVIYNWFHDRTVFDAVYKLGKFNGAEYPGEETTPLTLFGYDSMSND